MSKEGEERKEKKRNEPHAADAFLSSLPSLTPTSPHLLPLQLLCDVAVEHLVFEPEQLLCLTRDPASQHAPIDSAHLDFGLQEVLGKLHCLEQLLLLVGEASVLRSRDAAEATGEGHVLLGGGCERERERDGDGSSPWLFLKNGNIRRAKKEVTKIFENLFHRRARHACVLPQPQYLPLRILRETWILSTAWLPLRQRRGECSLCELFVFGFMLTRGRAGDVRPFSQPPLSLLNFKTHQNTAAASPASP